MAAASAMASCSPAAPRAPAAAHRWQHRLGRPPRRSRRSSSTRPAGRPGRAPAARSREHWPARRRRFAARLAGGPASSRSGGHRDHRAPHRDVHRDADAIEPRRGHPGMAGRVGTPTAPYIIGAGADPVAPTRPRRRPPPRRPATTAPGRTERPRVTVRDRKLDRRLQAGCEHVGTAYAAVVLAVVVLVGATACSGDDAAPCGDRSKSACRCPARSRPSRGPVGAPGQGHLPVRRVPRHGGRRDLRPIRHHAAPRSALREPDRRLGQHAVAAATPAGSTRPCRCTPRSSMYPDSRSTSPPRSRAWASHPATRRGSCRARRP